MPDEVTESQIIAYAESQGVTLTPEQLRRWRKAGVFPRPSRLGLGRGKGTSSRYPEAAKQWAVDLARVLAAHRSLSAAAWALWLKGYPLTAQARAHILRTTRRAIGGFTRWARGEFDLESALAKRARKHPVVGTSLQALIGGPVERSDLESAWETMEAGGLPSGPEGVEGFVAAYRGQSLAAWTEALTAAPDAVLEQVRNEVLVGHLVWEALRGDGASVVPPLHVVIWFGLTRASPQGSAFAGSLREAIARGELPQIVTGFRELLPGIRAAAALIDSISGKSRR